MEAGPREIAADSRVPESTSYAPLYVRLGEQVERFSLAMARIDGELRSAAPTEIDGHYPRFSGLIDSVLGAISEIEAEARRGHLDVAPLRRYFSQLTGRWFLRGPLNEWSHRKPFGYAGDYRIIDMILNGATSDSGIERLFDLYFLRLPAARAVVERRPLIVAKVAAWVVANRSERDAVIASVGSGPAREVQDMARLPQFEGSRFVLIDTQSEALELAGATLRATAPGADVELRNENIYSYLTEQGSDLRGRFRTAVDVIYSIGVMDYIPAAVVPRFLSLFWKTLTPGGMCVIGNFDPSNPSRTYMDWVLDWPLHYRTQAELKDFVNRGCPGAVDVRVEATGSGVNNFVTFFAPLDGSGS